GDAGVRLGDGVGLEGDAAVGGWGEDVGVGGEIHAGGLGAGFAAVTVGAEDLDGLGVQRDAALLVGLGVFLVDVGADLGGGAAVGDHGVVQGDALAAQAAQLAAAGPVIMVSQTRVPQSSFFCQAALSRRAASSALGGSGSGCGRDGLLATVSSGFTAIHFQRIAVDRAPERIQWI